MRRMRHEDFTQEELETSDDIIWQVILPAYDIINARVRAGWRPPSPEEAEAVMQEIFASLREQGKTGPFDDLERLRNAMTARLDQMEQEKDERDELQEARLRRIIREDLQGFLDKTANIAYKGHIQDPTFDAPWQKDLPNKQLARQVKQIWAAEADHDFMKRVVKVHWIKHKNMGVENLMGNLNRFLSMSGENEISTMGYPPNTTSFSSNWGPIGVVVQGHTTVAANRMSSLFSGFTGNISPELLDKYKSSGVPKRPTLFSGVADPSSLAGDFILDKKSFNQSMVGGNEFIVANWKPVGIVLSLGVRDSLFKQALGEETKYMSREDAETIVSAVEQSGLPIYSDWDEDEINMWRDRVRGAVASEPMTPVESPVEPAVEPPVTEARLRRLIREMASEQPLYTGIVI